MRGSLCRAFAECVRGRERQAGRHCVKRKIVQRLEERSLVQRTRGREESVEISRLVRALHCSGALLPCTLLCLCILTFPLFFSLGSRSFRTTKHCAALALLFYRRTREEREQRAEFRLLLLLPWPPSPPSARNQRVMMMMAVVMVVVRRRRLKGKRMRGERPSNHVTEWNQQQQPTLSS